MNAGQWMNLMLWAGIALLFLAASLAGAIREDDDE